MSALSIPRLLAIIDIGLVFVIVCVLTGYVVRAICSHPGMCP